MQQSAAHLINWTDPTECALVDLAGQAFNLGRWTEELHARLKELPVVDPQRLTKILMWVEERCGLRRRVAVQTLPEERRPVVAELRTLRNKLGETGDVWITVEGNPLPKVV